MVEEFRDIKGYEGIYQVSNLGRVKSLKRLRVPKERFLKVNTDGNGYLKVNLSFNGKVKNAVIHKLVAIAFLDHNPNGMITVIDHIDNNKLNNRLENLQLVTQRYNASKDKTGGSSKYVGVSWDKNAGKWKVEITIKGNRKYLGCFINEEEANDAYQKKLKTVL